MRPVPEWLRHPRFDADRLLMAAWCRLQGEHDAGNAIARSVIGDLTGEKERALDELQRMIDGRLECEDDPEHYAWTSEGLYRPGAGWTWEEWRDHRLPELEKDLLAEAERVCAPWLAVA